LKDYIQGSSLGGIFAEDKAIALAAVRAIAIATSGTADINERPEHYTANRATLVIPMSCLEMPSRGFILLPEAINRNPHSSLSAQVRVSIGLARIRKQT